MTEAAAKKANCTYECCDQTECAGTAPGDGSCCLSMKMVSGTGTKEDR